jgi:hypothetical protein
MNDDLTGTGFVRCDDGVIRFVGVRLPEGTVLALGFERDRHGIVRYVGGPVDNYAGAGSVQAALARWDVQRPTAKPKRRR